MIFCRSSGPYFELLKHEVLKHLQGFITALVQALLVWTQVLLAMVLFSIMVGLLVAVFA
jgi:hypothetical protein